MSVARLLSYRVGEEPKEVRAIKHIRRMTGGAQSQMILASDGKLYIVKLTNNPQSKRTLFNEMFASALAKKISLPVPPTAIMKISSDFISNSPGMFLEGAHGKFQCEPGLHFASEYVLNGTTGAAVDYLASPMLEKVGNIKDFAGALVFDLWTGNTDFRQAVFNKPTRTATVPYQAWFIDFGHCFNCGHWGFPDRFPALLYRQPIVYAGIFGPLWCSPWVLAIENMHEEFIWESALKPPSEWYDYDHRALAGLVRELSARRNAVRELLSTCKNYSSATFPCWKDTRSRRMPINTDEAGSRLLRAMRLKIKRHQNADARAKAV